MSVNMIALIIYCAIGVMVIMLAICFNLIRMVKELEKKVKCISNDNEQHYKAELQLQSYFNSVDTSINKLRGSLEILTAGTDGKLNDIQRQLSRIECQLRKLQCDTAINGNRLHDIVEWTGIDRETEEKEHDDVDNVSCVEYLADKAVLADIVDPANLEKEDEKHEPLVSYNWTFPYNDRVSGINRVPVVGQWYLCVGTIKGLTNDSGEPMVFTDEGLFNGEDFITSRDQRFEKVFAYIKKPSSADIMKEVFNIALKERG